MVNKRIGMTVILNRPGFDASPAVITFVNDDETVDITFFPRGGGSHGAERVKHVNDVEPGDIHWRVK